MFHKNEIKCMTKEYQAGANIKILVLPYGSTVIGVVI